MAGKRATKASPVPPGTHASSVPSAGPIGPTGYPPTNYAEPAAAMPAGPEVTHISLPSAWPTTAPVLGGISASAGPVAPLFGNAEMHPGVLPDDDPPYPPDTREGAPTPMSNLPFQNAPMVPSAQLAPAGQVTLPSGGVPMATTSEPAGEVPFRPADTTEQGR